MIPIVRKNAGFENITINHKIQFSEIRKIVLEIWLKLGPSINATSNFTSEISRDSFLSPQPHIFEMPARVFQVRKRFVPRHIAPNLGLWVSYRNVLRYLPIHLSAGCSLPRVKAHRLVLESASKFSFQRNPASLEKPIVRIWKHTHRACVLMLRARDSTWSSVFPFVRLNIRDKIVRQRNQTT